MRRILAWFLGDDGMCPSCAGALVHHEADYHVCRDCEVVVDFNAGAWRYSGGWQMRRLPGVLGIPFDRTAA